MSTVETKGTSWVHVKGLPDDVTKAAIRTFFTSYGGVMDVNLKYGEDKKKIQGEANVLFKARDAVDKLLAEKSVTMQKNELEITETEVEEEKEEEHAISIEALRCVICKIDQFPNVAAYHNHKKGKHHQSVFKIFRGKRTAVLQLLRAESKMSVDRAYDLIWRKRHPNQKNEFCEICQLSIHSRPQTHENSAEHKLVKNFLHPKCCDVTFTDRTKYETHIFSLKHLQNLYEKKKNQKEKQKDGERYSMKKAIEIYKKCDSDLNDLREEYGDLDLNEELPAFDKQPMGLNFIVKKINYYCMCCDQKFFANMPAVEYHCRSFNHYECMTDYITEVEKEFAEKKAKNPQQDVTIKKRALTTSESQAEGEKAKEGKPAKKIKTEKEDEGSDDNLEEAEENDDQDDDAAMEEEHDDQERDSEVEDEEQHSDQEEVGGESDVQAVEEQEPEAEVKKEATDDEDEISEVPVEETIKEEEKEEEEEEEEEEEPKPVKAARGRRGRGRGRGTLRRKF